MFEIVLKGTFVFTVIRLKERLTLAGISASMSLFFTERYSANFAKTVS